ncbi:acyl-CoA dehydrogenase family protein [Streptomyces sp. NBC_00249]|uniref:acyl-CoA dehydrogenase family protein n=1 Tax=Streptomyces sp. NBC_00249 TaxID=2975690 RepID=UPI00225B2E4B|nr:acyl-CoA dehydrogenase family protein [Streptomyces sp. NBC_00249]MCX5199481.1 acyl-CoA dehydrogenase family protein [Streptomyces sp. NBC_00249]
MNTEGPRTPAADGAPRTEALGALAARSAERTESERRLPVDVVEALRDAGFARHLVPARWGGTDGTYTTLLHAVAEIGESCASTAWNAAVHAILGRMVSHLPDKGLAEVWGTGAGADELLAASIAPSGHVTRTADGYRLSGTWSFASGVDHAAWVLLGALTPEREYRFFLVPRTRCRVLDTWDNVGLAGTGSNAVALDDVPVPHHLTCTQADLMAGSVETGPAKVPFKAVNGLTFVAPALGAARSALRASAARMASKTEITGGAARANPAVQTALARAGAEIDAAQLLLERAAAVADRGATGALERARAPRDFAYAAELLASAVDRLFRTGGARTQTATDPVQRAWRDVNCAAGHAVLQFGSTVGTFSTHLMDGEHHHA